MNGKYIHSVKLAALAFVLLSLSACVSHVKTTVSTYRATVSLPAEASFFIKPQLEPPASFDELEFNFFADRLAAQLLERGFRSAGPEQASHTLTLQYDNQRQKKETNNARLHFHTAIGYRYRYGSVVVLDRSDYDEFEFARRMRISIAENTDSAEKVLSLSAVSYGQCEYLSSVFDEMVTAVLDSMDSPNGSINPVKVVTKKPCSGKN